MSGLGLDAQKQTASNFLKEGDLIIKEFLEIESGKKINENNWMRQLNLPDYIGTQFWLQSSTDSVEMFHLFLLFEIGE